MTHSPAGRVAAPFLRLLMCALLLITLVPGCAVRSRSGAGEVALAGTYALVSVNGTAVPCDVRHGAQNIRVKSGVFVFGADATCRSRIDFAGPTGHEVRREVQATYTRQGSSLRMKWKGAGVTRGNVDGDIFTLENEGMRFVYRREAG